MKDNGFFNIVYTLIISMFGALAKEINDKTKGHETISIFLGEIILHGFSGWIFGLAAQRYLGLMDMTAITVFAGIGGLFGFDLVKMILKIALRIVVSSKDIELEDKDFDNLGGKDNETNK